MATIAQRRRLANGAPPALKAGLSVAGGVVSSSLENVGGAQRPQPLLLAISAGGAGGAEPVPVATQRGLSGIPPLVLECKSGAQDASEPLPSRGEESPAAAPTEETGAGLGGGNEASDATASISIAARRGSADSLASDVHPQKTAAKPLSIAARRGLAGSVVLDVDPQKTAAKPPSMAARRGLADLGTDSQKPAGKPLSIAACRGLADLATDSQEPAAKPLSIAARRGLADAPALATDSQRTAAKPLSIAARRGLADAPALDTDSQRTAEKPPSMAARRGLAEAPAPDADSQGTAEKPPSMAARRGLLDLCIDSQQPAAKPSSILARRVLPSAGALAIDPQKALGKQLHPQVPSLDLAKVRCQASGHLESPLSLSSLASTAWETFGAEPLTPQHTDVSIDDWGYDVIDVLGQGTMGVVSSVRRRSDGAELACKHVRSSDREPLVGLCREYELMSSLSHSSIVSPIAIYECLHNAWMCMEWCRGGSIEEYIQSRGPFEEASVHVLALELLAGIDYMHCKRVVHGDIKPANLLLQSEASGLKIADFGSARRVGCAADGLVMLSERGTQLYSAPEMRFGLQWNERIDVWASGLCIFFMLRADQPFDGASRKVTKQFRKGHLPELAWGKGEFGKGTRDLVTQCLTVEMRDRPTAMELVRHGALEHLQPQSARAASETHGSSANCGWLLLFAPAAVLADQHPRGQATKDPLEAALAKLVRNRSMRGAGQKLCKACMHESPL